PAQVWSQDVRASILSTESSQELLVRAAPACSARQASTAAMKSTTPLAIRTRPRSPYGRTTSWIGVDTTGLPAARYSGVFVGLMNFVEAFCANGNIATSQLARYEGSCE